LKKKFYSQWQDSIRFNTMFVLISWYYYSGLLSCPPCSDRPTVSIRTGRRGTINFFSPWCQQPIKNNWYSAAAIILQSFKSHTPYTAAAQCLFIAANIRSSDAAFSHKRTAPAMALYEQSSAKLGANDFIMLRPVQSMHVHVHSLCGVHFPSPYIAYRAASFFSSFHRRSVWSCTYSTCARVFDVGIYPQFIPANLTTLSTVTVWISSAARDLLLIQQIWCGGAYPDCYPIDNWKCSIE